MLGYNKVKNLLKLTDEQLNFWGIVEPEELDSDIEKDINLDFEEEAEETKSYNKVQKVVIKPLINVKEAYCEAPNDLLFKHPFSLINIAKKGSGKTSLNINLLNIYQNMFDIIILFSPTFKFDKNYQEALNNDIIKLNEKYIFPHYKDETLKKIIKQIKREIKKKTNKKILIVFDDCISELPKFGTNQLDILARNQRHLGISYMLISQEYRAIKPSIRKNVDGIVIFDSDQLLERNAIIDENSGKIGKNRFEKMWSSACKERFKFLCCRPIETDIYKKYSYCFEYFINPFEYDNSRFDIAELYRNKTEDIPLESIKDKVE